jgi:hypothetical protein
LGTVATIHFDILRMVRRRTYSRDGIIPSGKKQLFQFSRAVHMTWVVGMVWRFLH